MDIIGRRTNIIIRIIQCDTRYIRIRIIRTPSIQDRRIFIILSLVIKLTQIIRQIIDLITKYTLEEGTNIKVFIMETQRQPPATIRQRISLEIAVITIDNAISIQILEANITRFRIRL